MTAVRHAATDFATSRDSQGRKSVGTYVIGPVAVVTECCSSYSRLDILRGYLTNTYFLLILHLWAPGVPGVISGVSPGVLNSDFSDLSGP